MERFLDSFGVTAADLEKAAQEEIESLFEKEDGVKYACTSIFTALDADNTSAEVVEQETLSAVRHLICSSIRNALRRKGVNTNPYGYDTYYYDIDWKEQREAAEYAATFLRTRTNYFEELEEAIELALLSY